MIIIESLRSDCWLQRGEEARKRGSCEVDVGSRVLMDTNTSREQDTLEGQLDHLKMRL